MLLSLLLLLVNKQESSNKNKNNNDNPALLYMSIQDLFSEVSSSIRER